MFCPHCGKQLPDGSAFCSACGARISAHSSVEAPMTSYGQASGQPNGVPYEPGDGQTANRQPTARQSANQYGRGSASPTPRRQSYDRNTYGSRTYAAGAGSASANGNYSKLGGWLLFFFVCWIISGVGCIVSGIGNLVALAPYLGMVGPVLAIASIAACLLYVVLGLVLFAMSYLVYRRNPNFLRFYQLIFIGLLALALVVMVGSLATSSGSAGNYLGYIVSALAGFVLYTMYFCKSERVRVYMGGTEHIRRAIFRIGV